MVDESGTEACNSGEAINLIQRGPSSFRISNSLYFYRDNVVNDTSKATVNTLMSYLIKDGNQSTPFSRAAIVSLYKKLRNKPEELDSLLSALKSKGTQPSRCVTIRRPWDGKLQFEGWSDWAHFTYLKIWRWPELFDIRVGHIKTCRYGFDRKFTSVCINPYHYEKICSSSKPYERGQENPLDHFQSHGRVADESIRSDQSSLSAVHISNENPDVTAPSSAHVFSKNPSLEHIGSKQSVHITGTETKSNAGDEEPNKRIPIATMEAFFLGSFEPKSWCSVTYYEHDNKIGDTFKAPSKTARIEIDGLVNLLAKDRFCLGAINNVRRTVHSMNIRDRIGQGIQLELLDNGDVWLRCLSDASVFVQSWILDAENGVHPAPGIHHVHPKMHLKVFGFHQYYSEIHHQIAKAVAVTSQERRDSCLSADNLSKFCTFRVSFGTGWSSGYPWESIELTPCWIEVQLHQALQLLDELLRKNLLHKVTPFWCYHQSTTSTSPE